MEVEETDVQSLFYCLCSDGHFDPSLSFFLIGIEGQSVEICNTVDIRGEINREIAMRITSDLNSKDRFFTDLNGYQVGQQYIIYILFTDTHILIKNLHTLHASVNYKGKAVSGAAVRGRSRLGRGICGYLSEPAHISTDFITICNYMELPLCSEVISKYSIL